MVDVLRSFEPLTLPRPRGAHRYDVFSPKLGRRLTLYRRNAFEAWLMLEADPAAKTFCERPSFMAVDGRRRVVDFWARYGDDECLVVLSETTPKTDRQLLAWLPEVRRRTLCLKQSVRHCRVRGYLALGVRPHINLFSLRYTNMVLASSAQLIGQSLRVYINADDLRCVCAFHR
jgi:hypothetical protein